MSLLTLEWREESGEKLRERSLTYLPHCVRFLSRRVCRSRSAAISAARLWTCAQLISNSALRLFSRSRSPHASTCTMSGLSRRTHGVSKMRRVLRSVNLFKGFVPSFTVLPPVYGEFHSLRFGGASPLEFSLGRRLGRRSVQQELLNCFRRPANWLSRSVRLSESFNRDSMLC